MSDLTTAAIAEDLHRLHEALYPLAEDSELMRAAAELARLGAELEALRADAEQKDRVLRECDCPRPINSAQDESTGWCVDNGHCGCGRNHLLGVRKGHGYPDAAMTKELGDG